MTEDQFRKLWGRYVIQVRSALRGSRLLDPATSLEDIEQEVMLKVWQALSGETEVERTASYIKRVTHNALIDAVRRAQAREVSRRNADVEVQGLMSSDNELDQEARLSGNQLADQVKAMLEQLESRRRQAVTLRLQGLTVAEIARVCDWPQPTTRNLVYRGLAQIREGLSRLGIDLKGEAD